MHVVMRLACSYANSANTLQVAMCMGAGHTWSATSSAGTLRAACTQMVPRATAAPCWAVVLLHCCVWHTYVQCHHTTSHVRAVHRPAVLLHWPPAVCGMPGHTAVPGLNCIAWVVPTMHRMAASTVVMRRACSHANSANTLQVAMCMW